MSKTRIAFIGAGNMASSLIGGLLAKGLDAAQIRASDPGADTRAKVAEQHGIELFADNAQAVQDADVIVIASHDPGLADYLLGSVAARVVRHAHCSVLVVRNVKS